MTIRTWILFLTLVTGCSSLRNGVIKEPIQLQGIHVNVDNLIETRGIEIEQTHIRIDTLFTNLFKSEPPQLYCEAWENAYFKELEFYYTSSLEHERYIFQKILRPRQPITAKSKWIDCLMLIRKKDCADGDNEHRLQRLPHILRDTSSIESSFHIIYTASDMLQEPCAITLKFLQHEVDWRKRMFESMLIQLEFISHNKSESLTEDDVFYLMNELPDRLTSRYAYDYVMQNEILPFEIENIIDYRFKDWGYSYDNTNLYGYSKFSGDPIIFTEDEVSTLINRVEEINNQQECTWCDRLISRLNQRFQ